MHNIEGHSGSVFKTVPSYISSKNEEPPPFNQLTFEMGTPQACWLHQSAPPLPHNFSQAVIRNVTPFTANNYRLKRSHVPSEVPRAFCRGSNDNCR